MKLQVNSAFIIILCLLFLNSCSSDKGRVEPSSGNKLSVVTTLFPLYDFAKNVAGEKADISLLIEPGIEPHSFEPKPGDIMKLNKADIFLFTNRNMEPWVQDLVTGLDNKRIVLIDASSGIQLIKNNADPHIWLDFTFALKMLDNISDGFVKKDPANADYYRSNTVSYKTKLEELDRKFKVALSGCRKDVIVHGGHFVFGYMAKRYGFRYVSAYGLSPDSEPSPKSLANLSDTLRKSGLRHIFYEELVTPRVAEVISKETGAELLMLHGAHNISKDDLGKGRTFLSIMEDNLENLRTGLQCR